MKRWTIAAVAVAISLSASTRAEEMRPASAGANIPATVPPSHMVRQGDTLWDITHRYYNDPYRWPQVWSFNPDITNPHWIYPDSMVRLRPDGGAMAATNGDGPQLVSRAVGAIHLREMGFIDADALQQTGQIIAAREDMMMMSYSDVVYARLQEGAEPKVGSTYTIYRDISKEERLENEGGHLVRIMGSFRLEDYDKKRDLGHGTIVENLEPIERGFKIAPMMRRFNNVSPRTNETAVQAKIVASIYPRHILANQQLVFVNVGAEQGVKTGNRFLVLRKGDEWRQLSGKRLGREIQPTVKLPKEPKDYPDEIVAEGTVLSVRPNSAAVLLTQAVRVVVIGDICEMRKGY